MIISMNYKQPNPTMHSTKMFEGITIEILIEIMNENPSLRGMIQGYISEWKLRHQLLNVEGVTSVTKIQDQDPEKGDFKVIYLGETITIEAKSVSTDSTKWDTLNDTWEGTVSLKSTDTREITINNKGIRCTHLERGQFDILAISCFAVWNEWDFKFMENEYLPSSHFSDRYLKTSFKVNPDTTPCLVPNPKEILHSVYLKKQKLK